MSQSAERSNYGFITISHKGKLINTSVGSRKYETQFTGEISDFPKTSGNVAGGYDHRPDLIANLFMNTPGFWWLICERNSIYDIFEQLNTGDQLYIPVKL